MKASNGEWKAHLNGKISPHLASELDIFENEVALKKQGKIEDRIFAETRLRRGAYGQRYDNGQRHDGRAKQQLSYPSPDATKGPNTLWDAPGMQRIKIPFGGLNATQLETLAELAEEYSDGIAHVTTRQDFQLHFIHIEDTPVADAAPGRGRDHDARGLRQHGAQRDRVPDRRRLPRAGVRRDALRQGDGLLPARPSGLPGLRPQVQDRVFRLPRQRLRADPAARSRARSR